MDRFAILVKHLISPGRIGPTLMTTRLSADDYDALYAVVRKELARIPRNLFPKVLADLEREGVITITVTETSVAVHMPEMPALRVFRARRDRRLH